MVASLGLVLWLAQASPELEHGKAACLQASEEGQNLRDRLELFAAKEKFLACSVRQCPAVVRQACQKWLDEVTPRLSTLVFRARDERGHDLTDVTTTLDGHSLTDVFSGRALSIDPGVHVFTFERDGQKVSERIVVREGEKERLVDVTLAAPPASTPPPPVASAPPAVSAPALAPGDGGPHYALAGVFTGVAVAGFASFAYFGATAQSDLNHLRESCAPNCSPSAVKADENRALVANISVAVGGAAALAAAWFWLSPLFVKGPPAHQAVQVTTEHGILEAKF